MIAKSEVCTNKKNIMHKTTLISIALLLVTAIACKKENNTPKTSTTIPTDTSGYFRIQENNFISSGGHTTTGSLIVFGNKASNPDTLMYYFKNFKTDDGPDLDVYISEELNPVNFTNIGDLKAITGNFFYKVKVTPSVNASAYVIVWCVDFNVNFGYAQLQL